MAGVANTQQFNKIYEYHMAPEEPPVYRNKGWQSPQSSVGAACLGIGNLFNPEKEFVTCSDCWMDRRGGSSGARGFWTSAHSINRMLLRSGIDPAGRGSTRMKGAKGLATMTLRH